MEMSWRIKMKDLDHGKKEEQEIMEERAWPWSRRRAGGKGWKKMSMKKIRAEGDHGRKSLIMK
jgi:hypothetical protein